MSHKTKNGDKSASPIFLQDGTTFNHYIESGLTKREYFAVMAMQGLLSNSLQVGSTNFKWVAEQSIGYADKLLKKLDNEQH